MSAILVYAYMYIGSKVMSAVVLTSPSSRFLPNNYYRILPLEWSADLDSGQT